MDPRQRCELKNSASYLSLIAVHQDLVGATIGEISFIVMLTSLGCLLGSFAVGLLMDLITRWEYICWTVWHSVLRSWSGSGRLCLRAPAPWHLSTGIKFQVQIEDNKIMFYKKQN